MEAPRPFLTLLCFGALAAAVGGVALTNARQEATGRAGLARTAAAFVRALEGESGESPLRYLSPDDRYLPESSETVRELAAVARAAAEVVLTRVEVSSGGASGVTELVLAETRYGNRPGVRTVRVGWARRPGGWTLDLEPR